MTITIGAIDDDTAILYMLEAMAGALGWPIKTSADPEYALEWVRMNQVDLLLVDYHMPKMSGMELIRRVRKISRSVAVIALTIEESRHVAKQLLLSGADDFISKPVRLADFSSRILLHAELMRYRNDMNWKERGKGLSENTARRVLSVFEEGLNGFTTMQIAGITQLAYPTAHRYLEYLANKGLISRRGEDVERSGRPCIVYSKADAGDGE